MWMFLSANLKVQREPSGVKCMQLQGASLYCVGGRTFQRKQASFILFDTVISKAGAHTSKRRVQREGRETYFQMSNV